MNAEQLSLTHYVLLLCAYKFLNTKDFLKDPRG